MAWWMWALGLAVAASRTTNPLLLGLIIAVCVCVVAWRRGDAPWALAFRYYLIAGAVVVALRVVVRVLLGTGSGSVVLLELPKVPLPSWTSGITLLGPVSADELLGGLYDGLRLATMLVCVGAANALANPKRLLKAMPPALHEVAAAAVVALSVFPQLAESVVRVRRARELRGTDRRRRSVLRSIVVPVLEDALDRSLLLAASMDARGYGRSGDRPRRERRVSAALMLLGLCGVAVGAYGLLDESTPAALQLPALGFGLAAGLGGFVLAGRSVRRTVYQPDRWRFPEVATVVSGVVAAALMVVESDQNPSGLFPLVSPPEWPVLPLLATLGVLLALLPIAVTPPPPRLAPAVRAAEPAPALREAPA
jgi:energy-coupling factor transport system permease protein